MATSTTKLGLTKPDFVDVVDITDLNDNADTLDSAVGFTVCTNATRPASPYTGQSIFETDTGDSFIWDGSAWQPGGGGGSIEISATAPSSPAAGDLWWDSDNGNLYIYYTDVDSSQWVAANGPQVFVGTAAPAGYQGQMWFDSSTGKMYVYYDDGSSAQWVSAIGGSLAGSIVGTAYALKTDAQTFASVSAGASSTITDLTLSYSLANSANKLLLFLNVSGQSASSHSQGITVSADGTPIQIGDAASSRARVTYASTGDSNYHPTTSGVVEYSPSTTSAISYTVQIVNTQSSTQTVYVNRSETDADNARGYRTTSSFLIMEVAG